MTDTDIDWTGAAEQLKGELKGTLSRFLNGDAAKIEDFLDELAVDIVEASRLGRDDLIDEIKDQVQIRGERLRLQANQKAWGFIRGVVGIASSIAIQVVTGLRVSVTPIIDTLTPELPFEGGE